jgi:hypothetical protein
MGQNNSPAADIAIPLFRDFMRRKGTLKILQLRVDVAYTLWSGKMVG